MLSPFQQRSQVSPFVVSPSNLVFFGGTNFFLARKNLLSSVSQNNRDGEEQKKVKARMTFFAEFFLVDHYVVSSPPPPSLHPPTSVGRKLPTNYDRPCSTLKDRRSRKKKAPFRHIKYLFILSSLFLWLYYVLQKKEAK